MTGMTMTAHVVSALTAACLLAGCGVGEAHIDTHGEAQAPLRVQAATPQVSDLYATYNATTTLAADGEAQVPARVAGEVVAVLVEEGDRVVQGQVLARLDGERLKLRMLQSDAELALQSGNYERNRSLFERGLASPAAFESLQADVAALTAASEIDRLNYSYTEIRAPITGVVSARNVRLGQHVQSGDLAFRISDTSRLLAELAVPQAEHERLRPGQTALLQAAAAGGTPIRARIARISPTVDTDSGNFRATIYLDNADGRLAPGMFTRVTVRVQTFPDALTVPATALVEENGRSVVYVVDSGTLARREVETGISSPACVQILHGIVPGDMVVTHATSALRAGTRVALQEQRISAGSTAGG